LAHEFALISLADQICEIPLGFTHISVLKQVNPHRQHGSARWFRACQLAAQSPRGEVLTAHAEARGKMERKKLILRVRAAV
jgi:hypothetical protein